jgi:hypothetical protein
MCPPETTWNKLRDAAALGIAVGFIVVLVFLPMTPEAGVDLRYAYIPAGKGDLGAVFNPYWTRLLFELLASVPFWVAYAGLMMISLAGLVLSTRILGGDLLFALLTYQFGVLLFYGQLDALVALGIALGWWGLGHRNPWMSGLGFSLASIKPHLSAPALLLLWWWFDGPSRAKSLVIPMLMVLVSFWRYGWWIPDWLNQVLSQNPGRMGSITLWEYVGPSVLLLWIPALLVQLPRQEKLLLFLATSALTMPYYQHWSLVALQAFPIKWLAWLGSMGFLFPVFGAKILEWIVLMPLAVYGRSVWIGWRNLASARQDGMNLS